jgi:hypothetical protein
MTNATLEASTSEVGSPPVYVLPVPQSVSAGQLVAAEAIVGAFHQQALQSLLEFVLDALSERRHDSNTRILTAGAVAMMDHAAAAGSAREDFSAFLDDDD